MKKEILMAPDLKEPNILTSIMKKNKKGLKLKVRSKVLRADVITA